MNCYFAPNKFIDMYEEKLDELDNFMWEVTSEVKESSEFNAIAMK